MNCNAVPPPPLNLWIDWITEFEANYGEYLFFRSALKIFFIL